ncbi:MAG: hypothetical protein ABI641_04495 [Caldimonas sp.]
MKSLAERSVLERVVLLVNHVIAAEPAAAERLRRHVGRLVRLEVGGWPGWLPAWPALDFRITPAGLVEWLEAATPEAADLRVSVDGSNPALGLVRLAGGERPDIKIDGDAGFATDINWLIDNLRWDLQDDLARVVGDAPARELARFGGAFARAVRRAARMLADLAERRPGAAAEPPLR